MSDKYNKEEPSVLQKIQNQTGCLLLVIGIAMLAFVLTDLFSSGTSIFGGSNSVGTIDGEDVDAQEYSVLVDNLLANVQAQNPGLELNDQIRASYKQQAWNLLVQQKLVAQEYETLGLMVGGAEIEDMTVGDNPHPRVIRAFQSPETNQFDRATFMQFLDGMESNPEQKEQWIAFENDLITQTKSEKYTALLEGMFYGTELEARHQIENNELTVNANIVGINYNTIADSTIEVTDKDIMSYVREHDYMYEQKASRDIEFVVFDVNPSKEDSAKTLEWIADNIDDFKTTEDDSLFVEIKGSETPYDGEFKVRGNFTPNVEEDLFAADSNDVLGPYENSGVYALFKITEIGEDSLRSVKASHILLSIPGRTAADTSKALSEARELLSDIRSGKTTFETEAASRNFDGSGSNGGDLGWMREGTQAVPEKFLDKALSTSNGNYFIVTTRNGVHIGKTTSNISTKTIKVARLTQTVSPSSATDKAEYKRAVEFLMAAREGTSFEEVAEANGYSKKVSKEINEEERRVSGINNGNIVARWLFADATSEGDISEIIEVDEKYVVAHCTKVRSEGLPEVEDIRSKVETIVRNQKKAEQLRPRFEEAIKYAESPEALATALETIVTPIPAANYNQGSIPYVGEDKTIAGAIFGVPVGQRSAIVEGDNGMYVIYINNHNQYEMPQEISQIKMDIAFELNQNLDAAIEQALLKLGEVKDERYKYFD